MERSRTAKLAAVEALPQKYRWLIWKYYRVKNEEIIAVNNLME